MGRFGFELAKEQTATFYGHPSVHQSHGEGIKCGTNGGTFEYYGGWEVHLNTTW